VTFLPLGLFSHRTYPSRREIPELSSRSVAPPSLSRRHGWTTAPPSAAGNLSLADSSKGRRRPRRPHGRGHRPWCQAAPAAAPCAPGAPCAMAVPSCALDAQDVAVDGASPTDASVVALARSLIPTVPHPAIEYNLPVLDVQRY
jgi:hypothetical protein